MKIDKTELGKSYDDLLNEVITLNSIISAQQKEIKQLRTECQECYDELDEQWNIVCRLLTAMDVSPISWHETTPEQIERAIKTATELRSKK